MGQQKHRCKTSDTALAEAGFQKDELAILTIMRRFCFSYMNAPYPYWEDALDVAVSKFGENGGPVVAMAILNVIRKMRVSRRTIFDFHNPYCGICATKLTECEERLIRTLQFVRKGDRSSATVEAMILCEGNDTGPTLDAMHKLAKLITVDVDAQQPVPG